MKGERWYSFFFIYYALLCIMTIYNLKKKKVQIQTNFNLNYDRLFILNVKNFNLPISGELVTKKVYI